MRKERNLMGLKINNLFNFNYNFNPRRGLRGFVNSYSAIYKLLRMSMTEIYA